MRVRDYKARYAVPATETVHKIANNTLEHVDAWGRRRVILHDTFILVFDPSSRFVRLNHGGWKSATTKERMGAMLPAGFDVFQRNHEWFIRTPKHDLDNGLPYINGRVLDLWECAYREPWTAGGENHMSLDVEDRYAFAS